MKQLENIEIRACKGITTEITEEAGGKIVISIQRETPNIYFQLPTVSAGEYAEVLSAYTDKDGNKAVVPPGWTVSGIQNENTIWGKDQGLVIYHIPKGVVNEINWKDSDNIEFLMKAYDQFVWTPVGFLTANATLDGIHFNEKFGRMNYHFDNLSEKDGYYEYLKGQLLWQKYSVDKYDGYYSSRYDISIDKETRRPKSVKGAIPCITVHDNVFGEHLAGMMYNNETVKTHLMYGAEYDTRLKWVIETGTVSVDDIVIDSTNLGNYSNNKNSSGEMVKTGEDGCINNIYGLTGNIKECTQEHKGRRDVLVPWKSVFRGGSFWDRGYKYTAFERSDSDDPFTEKEIGFRVTLWIK